MHQMNICLPEHQVSSFVEALINDQLPKFRESDKKIFISREESLALLCCSPGTLQKLRDTESIDFYPLTSKLIIYNRESIINFIESKRNKL